jgi:monovalent cation/hydrogen antiporter
VMTFNAGMRWEHRRHGFHPSRPTLRPSVGSGLLVSWAGMRGIVSLAAALALPTQFPFRGLIVLTAFAVVLGTLVIQGLTLKPLIRALALPDDDPVGREVDSAREQALQAGLRVLALEDPAVANPVRHEFTSHLRAPVAGDDGFASTTRHHELHRRALEAARQTVLEMRATDEIGDDAFHRIEEELDWLEMVTRQGDDA